MGTHYLVLSSRRNILTPESALLDQLGLVIFVAALSVPSGKGDSPRCVSGVLGVIRREVV